MREQIRISLTLANSQSQSLLRSRSTTTYIFGRPPLIIYNLAGTALQRYTFIHPFIDDRKSSKVRLSTEVKQFSHDDTLPQDIQNLRTCCAFRFLDSIVYNVSCNLFINTLQSHDLSFYQADSVFMLFEQF